jgi:hypothetical protein
MVRRRSTQGEKEWTFFGGGGGWHCSDNSQRVGLSMVPCLLLQLLFFKTLITWMDEGFTSRASFFFCFDLYLPFGGLFNLRVKYNNSHGTCHCSKRSSYIYGRLWPSSSPFIGQEKKGNDGWTPTTEQHLIRPTKYNILVIPNRISSFQPNRKISYP